jgi:glycosyltransferase involved in cell wall biosynthesis
MKIGYFVTKFPYSQQHKDYAYGGSSLAAYYLSAEMAKRGHEVNVFTTSINSEDSIEKNENVTIYRYGTNFRIHTSNISFGMFKKPMDHNVDIIHTHFDIPPGPLAGLRYAKKKKNPFIVTYHGDWVESYGGLIRRIGVGLHNKYLVDKVLSYADAIISPSECYINESRFLRKYREKIVVIPNGINLKDFDISYSKEECRNKLGLPINKKILLFFGYLSPYKGPEVLLKAMPEIIKNVPDVELVFAGKGEMKDELILLSKRLGIETYVKFVGFVEDCLKPYYYKASDIFCLPSMMSTESFGIVNLEAMACSVPIVSSNIGGIPDVVKDGENGLLVKPNDTKELANAIIYLLKNEYLRKEMGENGREKLERYSWETIADKTENVYKEVLI